MNADVSIRQATPTDLPNIKEIIDKSFSWVISFFAAQSVDFEEGKILVAESEGSIAGFAKLVEFNLGSVKYGCILWLAVDPTKRRKGYAAVLVNAGYKYFTQNGAREVFASVRRSNKASLATFHKEGFIQVGFLSLRRHFGWRLFSFYRSIWYAPTEVVLVKHPQK